MRRRGRGSMGLFDPRLAHTLAYILSSRGKCDLTISPRLRINALLADNLQLLS
jgi:hypothetical protein